MDKTDANIDQSDANIYQSEGKVDQSDANMDKSDANMDRSVGNLDQTDGNMDQTDANMDQTDANMDQTDANMDQTAANIDQTDANIDQIDANIDQTDANIDQTDANMEQLDANIDQIDANIDQIDANVEQTDVNMDQLYAQATALARTISELPEDGLNVTLDKVVQIINTAVLNTTSGRLSLVVQPSNCPGSPETAVEVKQEPESEHEDEFETIFNEVIKNQNTIETTNIKRPKKSRKAKSKSKKKEVSKATSKSYQRKMKSVIKKEKIQDVVSDLNEDHLELFDKVKDKDENSDSDNDTDAYDPNEMYEEIITKPAKKRKLNKTPKKTKPISSTSDDKITNIGDYAIEKQMDPLPCVVCIDEPFKSIQYTRMKDLMDHIMDTHTSIPEGKQRPHLKCYFQGCDKDWPYYRKKLAIQGVCGYYQYIAHLEKEHNVPKPANIKVLECKECNYSTIVPRNYKAHMYNKKHAYNCIPCSACGKLIHRRNMRQHMSFIHNTGPPKTCPHCFKIYKSEETLNNHIKSIHEDSKPYLCSECPMKFLNSYSFNDHMLMKHGTNPTNREPLKCDHCEWKTLNRGHMKRHLKDHHEGSVNGFICQKCGRKLRNSGSLRRHTTMYHSAKKDPLKVIKCEHCSYTCRHPEYMKKHIRIHSGKRYQCDLCTYSTPYRENLPKHRRTHTNNEPVEKRVKSAVVNHSAPAGFLDMNLQPSTKHEKSTMNSHIIPGFLNQNLEPHKDFTSGSVQHEKFDFNSPFSSGFMQPPIMKNSSGSYAQLGAESLALEQSSSDALSHIINQ